MTTIADQPNRAGRPRQRAEPLGIKSVEKAFEVLDALARSDRPRSLTELSVETGMEPSKLHRYLVSLCGRGIVKRTEPSNHYDLGPGILALGLASLSRIDEFEVARGATDQLRETLGESAFCYVWSQAGPVLVYVRRPSYALVSPRIGSIVPLLHSATGPVFLAHMPTDLTDPVLVRDAADRGLDDAKGHAMAARLVERVRIDGMCWSDTTVMPDAAACAAPIFTSQGDLFGVVGVSFYLHGAKQPPQANIIDAVIRVSRAASNQLGHFP